MNAQFRDRFMTLWKKHFADAELPMGFYYTDEEIGRAPRCPASGHACLIDQLSLVREGKTLCVSCDSLCCFGAMRYLGFRKETMPDFEYFLSCGIPGKVTGERYKKSPEIVRQAMSNQPSFAAPAKYGVFKRWDKLAENDAVEVVIFLAIPDVLSGLFTLANFDETDPCSVIAPFAAGCGSITLYPYLEKDRDRPRSVIGMFDVSARPCVPASTISFAAPMSKFLRMAGNMEESFLTTDSWAKVKRRIKGGLRG